MNIVINAVLLFILVALSAFFSGSEIAIAASNKLRLKKSAEAGNKTAALAGYITDNFTRSLSTILVGNNLVNIASSSVATILAVSLIGDVAGPTVSTVAMTLIVLMFGETLPKIIAAEYADKIVLLISYPLRFFMFLFTPVVYVVSKLVGLLSKLWTKKDDTPSVTTEELCTILDTIEEEGVFTEREGELIKSAIRFTDVTAHEIMIPRVDVFSFDIEDDYNALLTDERIYKYSRIPVFEESFDNILGILSSKKLMKAKLAGEEPDIRQMLSEPIYVHMTRDISSILMEFRRTHTHMAFVVDEFGGVMGILTLEDILEEIVGDIFDERDEVEEEVISQTEDSYVVDGSMNIYDMFELIGFDARDFESEYTTVGGWATEVLDRFPEGGDSFDYKNLTVTVLEAQAMRVEKVRIDINEPEEDDDGDSGDVEAAGEKEEDGENDTGESGNMKNSEKQD